MRAAILLQTGFGVTPSPNGQSGLDDLMTMLTRIYPDRDETWLGIRTHDYPVEHDVEQILRRDPDKIIHVGHSFGCGHGLLRFARALEEQSQVIDLACCIDPVPDTFMGHFFRTAAPFPDFPTNVYDVLLARTLNKPSFFDPWGRDVVHPNVIQRIIYGPLPVPTVPPGTRYIPDSTCRHCNIDNDPILHEAIITAIDLQLR